MGFDRLGELEARADSRFQTSGSKHVIDRRRRFGEIGGRGVADREPEQTGIAGVELADGHPRRGLHPSHDDHPCAGGE